MQRSRSWNRAQRRTVTARTGPPEPESIPLRDSANGFPGSVRRTLLLLHGADPVGPVVLLQAQLLLMQVHWGRVDPGSLQVQPEPLAPQPPGHNRTAGPGSDGEANC